MDTKATTTAKTETPFRVAKEHVGVPVRVDLPGTNHRVDDGSNGKTGDWWCIHTNQVDCECRLKYVHAGPSPCNKKHCEIIVWPTDNDPNLVKLYEEGVRDGGAPSIKKYEKSMGRCISWYKIRPS